MTPEEHIEVTIEKGKVTVTDRSSGMKGWVRSCGRRQIILLPSGQLQDVYIVSRTVEITFPLGPKRKYTQAHAYRIRRREDV